MAQKIHEWDAAHDFFLAALVSEKNVIILFMVRCSGPCVRHYGSQKAAFLSIYQAVLLRTVNVAQALQVRLCTGHTTGSSS